MVATYELNWRTNMCTFRSVVMAGSLLLFASTTPVIAADSAQDNGVDIRLKGSKGGAESRSNNENNYRGLPLRAKDTKVLILPVINGSGEKDDRQRFDQAVKGDQELQKQFTECDFDIISGPGVHKMLIDNDIDLTNEEYWTRATLYEAGKKVGAHIVVFIVLDSVEQVRQLTPYSKDQELVARVRTRTWIVDAANEKAFVAGKRTEASTKNFIYPGLDSGARLIRNAVPKAVKAGVEEFLASYKKAK